MRCGISQGDNMRPCSNLCLTRCLFQRTFTNGLKTIQDCDHPLGPLQDMVNHPLCQPSFWFPAGCGHKAAVGPAGGVVHSHVPCQWVSSMGGRCAARRQEISPHKCVNMALPVHAHMNLRRMIEYLSVLTSLISSLAHRAEWCQ